MLSIIIILVYGKLGYRYPLCEKTIIIVISLRSEVLDVDKDMTYTKIAFVARKFPPIAGGMERVAKDLFEGLAEIADVTLLLPGSQSRNPIAVPLLFIKLTRHLMMEKVDVIYLQDALLSPLTILGKIFSVPVFVQTHGLDVTYNKLGYQLLIVPWVMKSDYIFSVSGETKMEVVKRGYPQERVFVVPNGIDVESWDDDVQEADRKESAHAIGSGYILSVGRLIERKGFDWFITNVLPQIIASGCDAKYVIVGEGNRRAEIEEAALKKGLKHAVVLLGRLEKSELIKIMQKASVFVSPNVPVLGDKEGFGISNIEATYFGIPVVASRVDGIPSHSGRSYWPLVEPLNAEKFSEAVVRITKPRFI